MLRNNLTNNTSRMHNNHANNNDEFMRTNFYVCVRAYKSEYSYTEKQ